MQSEKQPSDSRIDALPCALCARALMGGISISNVVRTRPAISAPTSVHCSRMLGRLVRLRFANARTVMNCGFYEENSPVPNAYYTHVQRKVCFFPLSFCGLKRIHMHIFTPNGKAIDRMATVTGVRGSHKTRATIANATKKYLYMKHTHTKMAKTLTVKCWKSHARRMLVATFGKMPRFFWFFLPLASSSSSPVPSPLPMLALLASPARKSAEAKKLFGTLNGHS